MKGYRTFIINTLEVITIILLYYIIGSVSLFPYVISLYLYKIFTSCFSHISISNVKEESKKLVFKTLFLLIISISLLFLILSIAISDTIGILLDIDHILLVFIMMGLSIFTKPLIKLLSEYFANKYRILKDLYLVLDNILLLIIALLTFRVFKLNNNLDIALLYLSKIISFILIMIVIYIAKSKELISIFKKEKNLTLKGEIKTILTTDTYKSTISIVKNSYFYISIIILYRILSTRYGYKLDEVGNILTFIYLYAMTIINYIVYIAKLINQKILREISIQNRIYNNFKIMLTIVIVCGFISPLTCKVIFNNPDMAIYLAMTNFVAIFILLYDITLEAIKNKTIVSISIFSGLVAKLILILPLVNSFYRMGYNLLYGDILSTIIGMFISIIINYIYLKKTDNTGKNYFDKFLNILYETIILSIILVIIQFVIPIDTSNYFKSVGLIAIYLLISLVFLKIKNRKRG